MERVYRNETFQQSSQRPFSPLETSESEPKVVSHDSVAVKESPEPTAATTKQPSISDTPPPLRSKEPTKSESVKPSPAESETQVSEVIPSPVNL
jgi:hypothetical protein